MHRERSGSLVRASRPDDNQLLVIRGPSRHSSSPAADGATHFHSLLEPLTVCLFRLGGAGGGRREEKLEDQPVHITVILATSFSRLLDQVRVPLLYRHTF